MLSIVSIKENAATLKMIQFSGNFKAVLQQPIWRPSQATPFKETGSVALIYLFEDLNIAPEKNIEFSRQQQLLVHGECSYLRLEPV